jgi:hypothetical protein
MEFFDIKKNLNGDNVIGFTSVKQWKGSKFADATNLSVYMSDDEGRAATKYLGLIDLFATTESIVVPTMTDVLRDAAVLEVNPGETITYDVKVNKESVQCVTTEDTSGLYQFPGIDETIFEVVLSFEYSKGDLLAYDVQRGMQIQVSKLHDVVPEGGEGYRHFVTLSANDKAKHFPPDKLKAGISYVKVGNTLGELDRDFSGLSLMNKPGGTMKNEFILSDPRGVETFVTAKAAAMRSNNLNDIAGQIRTRANSKLESLGGAEGMFVITKMGAQGGVIPKGAVIGTTLEYLVMAENAQMEAHSLLFARAGKFRDSNGGYSYINEGLYHQRRRGFIQKYSKPGGLTMSHLKNVATYAFGNNTMPVQDRILRLKCGKQAYHNVLQLIRDHAITQVEKLPSFAYGNDPMVTKALITGDLNNLKVGTLEFRQATIPTIGTIVAEHDPSMDFVPMVDRHHAGFYGDNGAAYTTYSIMIEDVTSPEATNVNKRVQNASLVAGGNATARTYYVKPEGQHIVWGGEQGRMPSRNNSDIFVSSTMKTMGRTIWMTSQSDVLDLDVSRTVTIELDERQ